MAKFKNLLLINNDFTKVPNKFFEIFVNDYDAMIVLLRLMNTMETFNNWDRLGNDTSFYFSLSKMLEMFQGCMSKPTLIKHLKNLESKGFIKKIVSNNPTQANYYIINCDMINSLCDTERKQVFIEDEIEDTQPALTLVSDDYKMKLTETSSSYATRVKDSWNALAKKYDLPQILQCKDDRLRKFRSILKLTELDEVDFFKRVDEALASSKFLRGIGSSWRADFDFLLQKKSIQKLLEGAYRDNKNQAFQKIQDINTMSYKEAQSLRQEMLYQEMLRKEQEELKQIGG